jgi:hypothetical protein
MWFREAARRVCLLLQHPENQGAMIRGTTWTPRQGQAIWGLRRCTPFRKHAHLHRHAQTPRTPHTCPLPATWWLCLQSLLGFREDYVIATKATGPSGQMTWIRGGPHNLDRKNIMAAIDGSLQRLQMDYIDLYQLHWPDRYQKSKLCCSANDKLPLKRSKHVDNHEVIIFDPTVQRFC